MAKLGPVAVVRRVRLITLACASLAVAGCGEGDDDSGDSGDSGENRAPTLTGSPPASVVVDAAYSFTPSASDADGDALLFGVDGLPPWAEFDSLTGTLSGSPGPDDAGTYRGIVVWVTDGDAETLLPAFDIVVEPAAASTNNPPTITGSPAESVVAGEVYRFTPQAADADGDPLSFTIRNRPPWATFSFTSGLLQGTPPSASAGTYRDVVIAVRDGEATSTLPPFSITVRLPGVNSAPTISGDPPVSVAAGTDYSFTPTAQDVDGDMLTFAAENAPDWASFDATTGELAGMPGAGDVGSYDGIVISVTDGVESAQLPAFSLEVTPESENTPPTITGTPPRNVVRGESYDFTPSADDADGDSLTFGISNRPAWASFDPATGRLNGTPDADDVGFYGNIRISVSDGEASAVLPQFSITVEAQNSAPTISGTPATSVEQGSPYSFTPAASDADGDALTFGVSNRPAWATFDTDTGRLAGTPGSTHVGTHSGIVISVSDGATTAQLDAFSIEVTAAPSNSAPTISGNPPGSVMQGELYSFTPSADDDDGDTLTFSIQNRPSWATFSTSTGLLRGTPSAAGMHADIRISVSDGQSSAQLASFSIEVTAPPPSNSAPTISGSAATIVVEGTAYLFQPSASDADGDVLTFSIANRPSWASFDTSTGRLSGIPAAGDVGTYTGIVISVTDGEEDAALPAFEIAVEAIALGTATLSWTAPDQRTDGSPLTDLAGFKIYWGTSSGSYPNQVTLDGPGITTYVIDNLAPGTWYFVTTAVDSNGIESGYSNVASKTIP